MQSLKNHFLIATPSLQDGEFDNTVIYLCEHTPQGAMGIIINRPVDIPLCDIAHDFGVSPPPVHLKDTPLYQGGPCHKERGFVLHETTARPWAHTVELTSTLSVTTSCDILKAICRGEGPTDYLVALGYASWEGGQLESELLDNAWLHAPGNEALLFCTPPEARHAMAARLLGVDMRMLSQEVGHA